MNKFLGLLFLLMMCQGCARNIILLSPEDEYALGDFFLEEEKYTKASAQYEKIRNDYPTSQYVTISQFKLAKTLFQRKRYNEAAIDFSLFMEFHPAHRLASEAQYLLALSKYKSMLNPERDVSLAKDALLEFDQYLRMFPDGAEKDQALKYRAEVEDHLLRHEYAIGRVYYRMRHYDASINRISAIPDKAHNPDLTLSSLYLLGQNYEAKKDWKKAAEMYQKTFSILKDSRYAQKSSKRLKKISHLIKD